MIKKMLRMVPVIAGMFILASCNGKEPPVSTSMNTKQNPESAVADIAKVVQKCWFQSGDKAFAAYRMANEVSSHSGKPRILLVPRRNPGGLPLLVVQAENKGTTSTGRFTNINAFGPLLNTSERDRILGDVNRWSRGDTQCT